MIALTNIITLNAEVIDFKMKLKQSIYDCLKPSLGDGSSIALKQPSSVVNYTKQ
jgi:hypothetical protein